MTTSSDPSHNHLSERADLLNIGAAVSARVMIGLSGAFAVISAVSGYMPAAAIFTLTAAAQGGLTWLSSRQLHHQATTRATRQETPAQAGTRCRNAFIRLALPPVLAGLGYLAADIVDPVAPPSTASTSQNVPR